MEPNLAPQSEPASLEDQAFQLTEREAEKSLLQERARLMIAAPGAHLSEDHPLGKLQRTAEASANAGAFFRQLSRELANGMRMDQLYLVLDWCMQAATCEERSLRSDLAEERIEYREAYERLCDRYPTTFHRNVPLEEMIPDVDDARRTNRASTEKPKSDQWEILIDGLKRYVHEHIRPGSGLQALLANDLGDFCARADPETMALLPALHRWLFNSAPTGCYGSRERIDRWCQPTNKDTP